MDDNPYEPPAGHSANLKDASSFSAVFFAVIAAVLNMVRLMFVIAGLAGLAWVAMVAVSLTGLFGSKWSGLAVMLVLSALVFVVTAFWKRHHGRRSYRQLYPPDPRN